MNVKGACAQVIFRFLRWHSHLNNLQAVDVNLSHIPDPLGSWTDSDQRIYQEALQETRRTGEENQVSGGREIVIEPGVRTRMRA